MPKQEEKITIQVSRTELNFLRYCRNTKFAEGTLTILDGQPKRLLKPIQNIRFDLSTDELPRIDLTASAVVE